MPAHTTQGSIGRLVASDGKPITAVQWRANRLVDMLAKSAARPYRLPAAAGKILDTAAEAVEFSLAKLAAVTYAANHCKVDAVLPDGTTTRCIKRDSSGARPCARRGATGLKRQRREEPAVVGMPAPAAVAVDLGIGEPQVRRRCKRTVQKMQEDDRLSRDELLFREHWRANRPVMKARPPGEARARFADLRARVLERERALTYSAAG